MPIQGKKGRRGFPLVCPSWVGVGVRMHRPQKESGGGAGWGTLSLQDASLRLFVLPPSLSSSLSSGFSLPGHSCSGKHC